MLHTTDIQTDNSIFSPHGRPTRKHRDALASAEPIRIDAGRADVDALSDLLVRGVSVGNEDQARDAYLNELISKPWGREYRVYADHFLDIWHLRIEPGHSTSMHAHPRKTTYLLCLAGQGQTKTMNGSVPVRAGTILRIGRGAFHATSCGPDDDPLMLIEVETPRNKFDLVRLEDNYRRAGVGYETNSTELPTPPKSYARLPNASFCEVSPCKCFSFSIHTGMEVFYRRHAIGDFLIPLGMAGVLSDELAILSNRADDGLKPNRDAHYLGITPLYERAQNH